MKKVFGFLFLLLILLATSHAWIDFSPQPWLMGLPFWLYFYMILHLLFVVVLYFFIKNDKTES